MTAPAADTARETLPFLAISRIRRRVGRHRDGVMGNRSLTCPPDLPARSNGTRHGRRRPRAHLPEAETPALGQKSNVIFTDRGNPLATESLGAPALPWSDADGSDEGGGSGRAGDEFPERPVPRIRRRVGHRPRGPSLPARRRGPAGRGRALGGALPLGSLHAVGWLYRRRRLLRHLGVRHHRGVAPGAGGVGPHVDPRLLRETVPPDHPRRHAGHHRHGRGVVSLLGHRQRGPDRHRRALGLGVSGQLPFRRHRDRTT